MTYHVSIIVRFMYISKINLHKTQISITIESMTIIKILIKEERIKMTILTHECPTRMIKTKRSIKHNNDKSMVFPN